MNIDEKAAKAKEWGIVHGYFGLAGGWIYKDIRIEMRGPHHGVLSRTGYKPVCQGWHKLYDKQAILIEKWLAEKN